MDYSIPVGSVGVRQFPPPLLMEKYFLENEKHGTTYIRGKRIKYYIRFWTYYKEKKLAFPIYAPDRDYELTPVKRYNVKHKHIAIQVMLIVAWPEPKPLWSNGTPARWVLLGSSCHGKNN
jgi:hypothetical protein